MICLIAKLLCVKFNKWQKLTIGIVIPVMFTFFVLLLFVDTYNHRKKELTQLQLVLTALEKSKNSDRIFDTETDKQLFLDSIRMYKKKIQEYAFNDSIHSFFIGKDEKVQHIIEQTLHTLNNQLQRYSYLNTICDDTYFYSEERDASNEIKIIEPENTTLTNLNIAVKLRNNVDVDSIKVMHVSIESEISGQRNILYCQSFKTKQPISAFIIPNHKDKKAIIKLGYVTEKEGKLIFNRTIYLIDE